MGIPAGPFYINDTLTFTVNTHSVSTGAATDADAVPTFRVYEDETATAIGSGSMAKLDDTNTTGFYSELLTLSAANGYEVGKSYSIYIQAAVAGVTGSQSLNFRVIATPPTTAQIETGVWDTAAGLETGYTLRQAMRLMAAALLGKASGLATTTAIYRNLPDTKARITATVDADGNRSAVTLDGT